MNVRLGRRARDKGRTARLKRLVQSLVIKGAARRPLAHVLKKRLFSRKIVEVTLRADPGWLTLTVTDDGVGIPDGTLERRLSEGHVGMSSQRTRVEVAGGRFEVRPNHPGTIVEVALPADAT